MTSEALEQAFLDHGLQVHEEILTLCSQHSEAQRSGRRFAGSGQHRNHRPEAFIPHAFTLAGFQSMTHKTKRRAVWNHAIADEGLAALLSEVRRNRKVLRLATAKRSTGRSCGLGCPTILIICIARAITGVSLLKYFARELVGCPLLSQFA